MREPRADARADRPAALVVVTSSTAVPERGRRARRRVQSGAVPSWSSHQLELPLVHYLDPNRGERRTHARARCLAKSPLVLRLLDRDGVDFFLKSKQLKFPGALVAELFGVTEGPLHEEVIKNILCIDGADHRRPLAGQPVADRALGRALPPAIRGFCEQLYEPGGDRPLRVHRRLREAVSGADDRDGDGGASRTPSACTTGRTGSRSSSRRTCCRSDLQIEQAGARVLRLCPRAARHPPGAIRAMT